MVLHGVQVAHDMRMYDKQGMDEILQGHGRTWTSEISQGSLVFCVGSVEFQ